MARYIDTEKLFEKIELLQPEFGNDNFSFIEQGDVLDEIESTPTEDVAPVIHGHWVGDEYDGFYDGYPVYDTFRCSECGEIIDNDGDTLPTYCLHCGAKMDEDVKVDE